MIMVIMVHYEQSFHICKWFQYLQMGCPIFFVASGFNAMCFVMRNYDGCMNRQNMKKYYYSRFKALAPAWYLAFLLIFTVNTFLLSVSGNTLSFGKNRGVLSIVCNLLFLNGLLPFCNNNVMPGGWYIGTTVILYALTPQMISAIGKCGNRIKFFIVTSFAGMVIWYALLRTLGGNFSRGGFAYYFFLVHYPNYLLGIMLYYDWDASIQMSRQNKLCLPFSFVAYAAAVVLFYSSVSARMILSAWMTALATYLMLYSLLPADQNIKPSVATKILSAFGRNSYYIYLLHAFWAWTFIQSTGKILGKMGVNFYTIPCFAVMLPVVLGLSYLTGSVFHGIVRRVTGLLP